VWLDEHPEGELAAELAGRTRTGTEPRPLPAALQELRPELAAPGCVQSAAAGEGVTEAPLLAEEEPVLEGRCLAEREHGHDAKQEQRCPSPPPESPGRAQQYRHEQDGSRRAAAGTGGGDHRKDTQEHGLPSAGAEGGDAEQDDQCDGRRARREGEQSGQDPRRGGSDDSDGSEKPDQGSTTQDRHDPVRIGDVAGQREGDDRRQQLSQRRDATR